MARHTISGIVHKTAYGFTIGGTAGSDDSPQSNGGALPVEWVSGSGNAYVRKFAVLRSNTVKIGGVNYVVLNTITDTALIGLSSPDLTDLSSLTKIEIAHYTDLSWDVKNTGTTLPNNPRQFLYVSPIGDPTDIVRVYAPINSVDADFLSTFKDGDTIYLNGEPYTLRRDNQASGQWVNIYTQNLVDPGDTLYLGSNFLKWTERVDTEPTAPHQFRQLPLPGGPNDVTLSITHVGTTITQALGTPTKNDDDELQWGDNLGLKIPNAWMQGRVDAWIDRFRFNGTHTTSTKSGEIAIAISSSSTRGNPTLPHPNLGSFVRERLVLTLSAPGYPDVRVNGIIPDDPSDPHVWKPVNSFDVIAFFNRIKGTDTSGLMQPTLQVYAPGGSAARTLLTNLRTGSDKIVSVSGIDYHFLTPFTAESSKDWVNIYNQAFPTLDDVTIGLNTNRWSTKTTDQLTSLDQFGVTISTSGSDFLAVYAPPSSPQRSFIEDLAKGELYIALDQDDSGSGSGSGIQQGPTLTDATRQEITISMVSGDNSFETVGLGTVNEEPYQWEIPDTDKVTLATFFSNLNDYDAITVTLDDGATVTVEDVRLSGQLSIQGTAQSALEITAAPSTRLSGRLSIESIAQSALKVTLSVRLAGRLSIESIGQAALEITFAPSARLSGRLAIESIAQSALRITEPPASRLAGRLSIEGIGQASLDLAVAPVRLAGRLSIRSIARATLTVAAGVRLSGRLSILGTARSTLAVAAPYTYDAADTSPTPIDRNVLDNVPTTSVVLAPKQGIAATWPDYIFPLQRGFSMGLEENKIRYDNKRSFSVERERTSVITRRESWRIHVTQAQLMHLLQFWKVTTRMGTIYSLGRDPVDKRQANLRIRNFNNIRRISPTLWGVSLYVEILPKYFST